MLHILLVHRWLYIQLVHNWGYCFTISKHFTYRLTSSIDKHISATFKENQQCMITQLKSVW